MIAKNKHPITNYFDLYNPLSTVVLGFPLISVLCVKSETIFHIRALVANRTLTGGFIAKEVHSNTIRFVFSAFDHLSISPPQQKKYFEA
jgi:hypothetical protein